MITETRGFTLIELLAVTLLLGALALLALPRLHETRNGAEVAVLQSDLRNLMLAQEIHFTDHMEYAEAIGLLDFNGSNGVAIDLRVGKGRGGGNGKGKRRDEGKGRKQGPGGDGTGWTARARHVERDHLCSVFVGDVKPFEPAEEERTIACEEGGTGAGPSGASR